MCFEMFWCVLMRFDMFWCVWCVLMCFDVFLKCFWSVNVLMCFFDMFWCVLMCFDMFWCALMCFDVFWDVLCLMCFDVFWYVLMCLMIVFDVSWCPSLHHIIILQCHSLWLHNTWTCDRLETLPQLIRVLEICLMYTRDIDENTAKPLVYGRTLISHLLDFCCQP